MGRVAPASVARNGARARSARTGPASSGTTADIATATRSLRCQASMRPDETRVSTCARSDTGPRTRQRPKSSESATQVTDAPGSAGAGPPTAVATTMSKVEGSPGSGGSTGAALPQQQSATVATETPRDALPFRTADRPDQGRGRTMIGRTAAGGPVNGQIPGPGPAAAALKLSERARRDGPRDLTAPRKADAATSEDS